VRSKVSDQKISSLIARLVLWLFSVQSRSSCNYELFLPGILSLSGLSAKWVELKLDQRYLLEHPSEKDTVALYIALGQPEAPRSLYKIGNEIIPSLSVVILLFCGAQLGFCFH